MTIRLTKINLIIIMGNLHGEPVVTYIYITRKFTRRASKRRCVLFAVVWREPGVIICRVLFAAGWRKPGVVCYHI